MGCEVVRPLLHPHVDGELVPARDEEVRQHLVGCPGCARECEELRALQAALRTSLPRFEPPPALQPRVEAALRQEGAVLPGRRRPRWVAGATAAAAVAAAAVLGVGAWVVGNPWSATARENALAREVIAHHNGSLTTDRTAGVQSSDPEVVGKWLAGKLPFAPVVPRLDGAGFGLLGGRVESLGGRPAATLVYRRGQHIFHLMARHGPEGITPGEIRLQEQQGRRVAHWSLACLDFWAACDIHVPEEDLIYFIGLVRKAMPVHSTLRIGASAQ
jgi:anti-sigma factor RsiW